MLTFAAVSKRFGAVQALDGCSFSVARGRMPGFLGPNGTGKATPMQAICDLAWRSSQVTAIPHCDRPGGGRDAS